jgi:hypothetical protein
MTGSVKSLTAGNFLNIFFDQKLLIPYCINNIQATGEGFSA